MIPAMAAADTNLTSQKEMDAKQDVARCGLLLDVDVRCWFFFPNNLKMFLVP